MICNICGEKIKKGDKISRTRRLRFSLVENKFNYYHRECYNLKKRGG